MSDKPITAEAHNAPQIGIHKFVPSDQQEPTKEQMDVIRDGLRKVARPKQKRPTKISRAILPIIVALILATLCRAEAQTDREVVASVLIAESGGERDVIQAMSAVMEVIQTRAKERHKNWLEIVTARKQFSCLNGRSLEQAVKQAKLHKRWNDAYRIAGGVTTDYTKGSNHYYSTRMMKYPPYWARSKTPSAVVQNHTFYRL